MSIKRKDVNHYLRQNTIPLLRELGFMGSLPHFRRITETSIDLITFQFDISGGGFVIELAQAKNEIFITNWGKEISQSNLTAHDLSKRQRIHPKGILENSLTNDWFRYDRKAD